MVRTHRTRAVAAIERACSEAAKSARDSERKWWRQEIAKIVDCPTDEILYRLLRISEKRGGK